MVEVLPIACTADVAMGQQVQLSKISWQHLSRSHAVNSTDESVQTVPRGKSSRGSFWSPNTEVEVTVRDSYAGVSVTSPCATSALTSSAAAAEVSDWCTTKGLSLYLLSTLLLSVQTTSAKLLGQCSKVAISQCHRSFTSPKSIADTWHAYSQAHMELELVSWCSSEAWPYSWEQYLHCCTSDLPSLLAPSKVKPCTMHTCTVRQSFKI